MHYVDQFLNQILKSTKNLYNYQTIHSCGMRRLKKHRNEKSQSI